MVLADPALGGKDERGVRAGPGGICQGEANAGGGLLAAMASELGDAGADEGRKTAQCDPDDERFLVLQSAVGGPAAVAGGRCGGVYGPDFFVRGLSRDVLGAVGGEGRAGVAGGGGRRGKAVAEV